MAAMDYNSPGTSRVLFSLKEQGIDREFIKEGHITMESEKYICIREAQSVVVIDMTEPTQHIRLPVTADSAIMNPHSPILAYKVKDGIEGTTQDQLEIFSIEANAKIKSYKMAEKVENWKWITPKLLGLVTLKAVYHWSIEESMEPVKISDVTQELAKHNTVRIIDYMYSPSEEWFAIIGRWRDPEYASKLFIQPCGSRRPRFKLGAHAAAYTNFIVEGNDTPCTLFCYAAARYLKNNYYFKLTVSDALGAQPAGEHGFGEKQSKVSTNEDEIPIAVQISEKYGLIYVITDEGLISIHELETAEAISSYRESDQVIICTAEGPSSGTFYSINKRGHVLLNKINHSTILSFLGDKLLTKGKPDELQKLCLEMLKENEEIAMNLENSLQEDINKRKEIEKELKRVRRKQNEFQKLNQEMLNESKDLKEENAKLRDKKDEIVTYVAESLQVETKVWREIKEQLTSKMAEISNYKKSQEEMLNEIEGIRKHSVEQMKEREKRITDLTESLKVEKSLRKEIVEQLGNEIKECQKSQEEMLNEIEGLKKHNAELTMERENFLRNLDDFRLWIEGFGSSNNHLDQATFTEFTYAELSEVTNDFSNSLKIGEGGYGPVYKAFLGLKPVAIKILRHDNPFGKKEFNQEVEILRRVRHPNLVMLLGACQEAQALVYELMPNGSLFDNLRNKQQPNALTWKRRICIASDICSALIVLHSAKPHGIVHGDLKPANILLDSNYRGKLSDFGICRDLHQTDTTITPHHYTVYPKGTLQYMEPEYLDTGEMTAQYDVYSFGIVLLELVTGRCPMVRGAHLRKLVEDAIKEGQNIVDSSAGEWPFEEAKRMMLLGLQCSDSRENRPDLEKEVWVQIESMRRISLRF